MIAAGHVTADSDDIDRDRRPPGLAGLRRRQVAGQRRPAALPAGATSRRSAKNRIHLDLHPGDGQRDAKVAQLLELGATKLWDAQLGPQSWVTLADPEGNELCVA